MVPQAVLWISELIKVKGQTKINLNTDNKCESFDFIKIPEKYFDDDIEADLIILL